MIHKFLWNIKFWFIGMGILIITPLIFAWGLLIEIPLMVGKKFDNESKD